MLRMTTTFLIWVIFASPLYGAEYFVSTDGDDRHDGRSRDTAFSSVQRGVDVLEEGDTLTIMPGEYFESVQREGLGGPDRDTVIRAEIAATVLLRGDVPAPAFRKVDEYRFVYVAEFQQPVQAVNELDTLTAFPELGNPALLDFMPGHFHHDKTAGKLYISTSDLQPPDNARYTISVIDGHGLYLEAPQRVIVDGLAATGFNTTADAAPNRYPGYNTHWGIIIGRGEHSVIRNATAFLNGGGICLHTEEEAGHNVIEHCVAYGNGRNIFGYSPNHDILRDSYAYRARGTGIRLYGGQREGNTQERNIAWGSGEADLNIKATFGPLKNSIALGDADVLETRDSIIGAHNSKHFTRDTPLDTIRFLEEEALDLDREFADAQNLDFRLQADSRFRNAGPDGADRGPFPYEENIFYLSPEGDDAADGLTVATAWRTPARAAEALRPGDTLYLKGGVYETGIELAIEGDGEEPLRVRGRGTDPVYITGPVAVTVGTEVEFERLNFLGPVTVRGGGELSFKNCLFAGPETGLIVEDVHSLRVTHSMFTGFADAGLDLRRTGDVFLSGNIFDNQHAPAMRLDDASTLVYSDYNSYSTADAIRQVSSQQSDLETMRGERMEQHSLVRTPTFTRTENAVYLENTTDFTVGGPLGTAIGFYHDTRFRDLGARIVEGPRVHSVTASTANVEWWATDDATFELAWGDTPECDNVITFEGRAFNSYGLRGLEPGQTYYARVKVVPEQDGAANSSEQTADVFSFTTVETDSTPTTYYVAPEGNDEDTGLSRENAWRTIAHAADRVRAGDTVLIAGGTYPEAVYLRATGDEGAPITFQGLPGERVDMAGEDVSLPFAFRVEGKAHVKFDSLHFSFYRGSYLQINRSEHIHLSRCMIDGRGRVSRPYGLRAEDVRGLELKNCVLIQNFIGMQVANCPDLRIENSVFFQNWIFDAVVYNNPDEHFHFKNNIVTDNLPDKVGVYMFEISYGPSFVEENNCYYLRIPKEDRDIVLFIDQEGEPMHTRNRMERFNLPGYIDKYGQSGSIVADPGFPALSDVDRDATGRDGNRIFPVDRLPGTARNFSDFFATNPELLERGIGLIPSDFDNGPQP